MTGNGDQNPSAYGGLFRSAAKLGLLLGSMEIEWTRVVPFLEQFSEELAGFQEFGVRNDHPWLQLGTMGEGKEFTHRATHLMERQGIAEDDLRRFLVRARHFEYPTTFFSMALSSEGERFFRYTLRRRQDIDNVVAMLLDSGVEADHLADLRDMARILNKDQVHAYSSVQGLSGEAKQGVIFSQPTDIQAWNRIGGLAEFLGFKTEEWNAFIPELEALGVPSFVSISFGAGEEAPGLSLVFQNLAIESLEKICGPFSEGPESFERAELLLRVCSRKRASRVELFLGEHGVGCVELTAS